MAQNDESGEDARSRHVNENDVEWIQKSHQTGFDIKRKKLAEEAGGEQLGCSLYELPPGGKSWPYHYHTANEEAIYVLEGRGTLRARRGTATITSGDYLTFPVGEEYARRVINDSDAPLRYLCFSTMNEPEISIYPDSNKVGAFAGSASATIDGEPLNRYFEQSDAVDYWTGETE
ncbi:cupin domain-containing protein [Natronosalvus halobius]|uniref:cupin domain-containing protein n=1 Tax=Natronosalvus halobius TaxID=2953746 RepID=UPI0020A1B2B4|nr:cupin domain-containing protein [Natronosalvus halobius]USZ73689.1 cupin domain-containing protein [Natronosalvus halobius]